MGKFFEKYRGTAEATGVVRMFPDPNFNTAHTGFGSWIGVMGVRHMALQVVDLDGAVELQGNNGDPNEAGEWYTIEELTEDGRIIVNDDPVNFIRVNVTTLTSGTPTLLLDLES